MRLPDPKIEAAELTTPAKLRERAAEHRRLAERVNPDLSWILRDMIIRDHLSQSAALERRAARLAVPD